MKHQYLFSYFQGNGEDGLHLACSDDGMRWCPLNGNKSLLEPRVGADKLMRDPHILKGPSGDFHMVWTVSWEEPSIGYAHSPDLIHWSEQKLLSVMSYEPKARNAWSPELVFDDQKGEFMIYWSTTIPGRFPETDDSNIEGRNHRIYYMKTKDFSCLQPAQILYDGGFNVIDADIVQDNGQFVMFIKNETRNPKTEKNIRFIIGQSLTGPYGPASEPITGDYWAEGPSGIKIDDRWHVYFDRYRENRYGLVTSQDLVKWTDRTDHVSFPVEARHGTVFRAPSSTVSQLMSL